MQSPSTALLDAGQLSQMSVLELGSGTGILAVLLSPLFRSWTATDVESLLPLIKKNIKRNAPRTSTAHIQVDELDWTWSEKQVFKFYGLDHANHNLLLAVDCLFNEALVKPFVNTLNQVNVEAVLIASELRSPEVLRLFLKEWLSNGRWEIYRACKRLEEGGQGLLGSKYVIWVGWPKKEFRRECKD